MCIIVSVPANKTVPVETLQTCWKNNPQGAGFMYTDGERVQVFKELKSFQKLYAAYIDARASFPDSNFILHFRISTHGKVNKENCHPFNVTDKLGFCHNGICYNVPVSKDYSDSIMLNKHILQNLPDNFLNNAAVTEMLATYIGSGSKLAFLDSDNTVTYINERAGVWDDGVWYSNSGYKSFGYYDYGGTRKSSVPPGTYSTGSGLFAGSSYPVPSKASYQGGSISKKRKKVNEMLAKRFLQDEKLDDKLITSIQVPDYKQRNYAMDVTTPGCDECGSELKTNQEQRMGYCERCWNNALNSDTL